jgi:hypothetical protein
MHISPHDPICAKPLSTLQDEGQQHVELLQEYASVLKEFRKRFSILSSVQVRIQLKVEHITGLRDGVSPRPRSRAMHDVGQD